jgi:hypothetical protein
MHIYVFMSISIVSKPIVKAQHQRHPPEYLGYNAIGCRPEG